MLSEKLIERKPIVLEDNQPFLSTKLLDILLLETDIPKEIAEEKNCELWYEIYHGEGKAFFPSMTYKGNVSCGILDSRKTTKDKHNAPITEETTSRIEFKDGTVYEGTVHNNEIDGKGKYIYPTGSIYEGQVKNGAKHGYGVFYNTEQGVRYEGEWKEGLKEGKGVLTKPNMIYEGTFHNGVIDGTGKIKWKNGNYYAGEMHKNKIEGNGFMIWADANEKYSGQWKDNLFNGFGVHICYEPKGEQKMIRNRYVGEWVNGKRHGYGVFFYSNGIKYEGFWENDVKEGFGVTHLLDRTLSIGEYKHDHLIEKPQSNSNTERESFTISGQKGTKGINLAHPPYIPETKATNVLSTEENRIKQIIEKEKAFKIHIDLSDLILLDSTIKDSLKEIDKILLRNLTEIGHWYLFISGRESLKELFELGTSIGHDSKSNINLVNSINPNTLHPIQNSPEEKKLMDSVQYDVILNNDVSFCLELRELWKFLKDYSMINTDMTLAEFDRIFFQGPKNYYEMFYLPESIPNEKIHNYSFSMIAKSKYDFEAKYLEVKQKSFEDKERYENLTQMRPEKDIHNRRQIILLRHFYEVLIRLAYYKFYDSPLALDIKVKTMIQTIKPLIRLKRKSSNSSKIDNLTLSTLSILDMKIKNYENSYELFFFEYEMALVCLFDRLNELSKSNSDVEGKDKTITYGFLYYKVLLKDKRLKALIPSKIAYCDLINRIHSNKKSIKDEGSSFDKYSSCAKLLYSEMIFYEFCEWMFFIGKKYFIVHSIEDNYEKVIELFDSFIRCSFKSKASSLTKYHYPQLYAHRRLEELEKIKQEHLKELERGKIEKERYTRERLRLSIEETNVKKEEEENSDLSEFDY